MYDAGVAHSQISNQDFMPQSYKWVVASRPRATDFGLDVPMFQPHNEMAEYIARGISQLEANGALNSRTARRALRVLTGITGPETVFPHLSCDEGELSALWLADRMSVELAIPESGNVYLRVTDEGGSEAELGFFGDLPVDRLRRHLRLLTLRVAAANPRWREIFKP